MLRNRLFEPIWLGLLSLILMLSFIGYFLHKEYNDEKSTMILEDRDQVFMTIFSDAKERTNQFISEGKDSFDLSYNSHVENLNVDFKVDVTNDEKKTNEVISFFESFSIDSVSGFSINPKDFPHKDNSKSMRVVASDSFQDLSGERLKNILNVLAADSEDGDRISICKYDVLKRMKPQIIFSMLLLLSTCLAYFFFFRQLKRERELTVLRNDFISNMSHELKTPVSTISVALEALKNFDASDNSEMRAEYIDISKHEVDRLGLLVDKALNISLFEQGKFVYNKQILNLDAEVESVLKILKVQLDNKQVELEFNKTGNSFAIHADKTHVVNVIHNLIENAIKYSEKDPLINIKLEEAADGIKLSIKDNGIGIAPQYQDRIFDKFFRVPQGNTHNTKGHGLGLSYVKEVIDKHNGTIQLKSGVGTGTTFIMKFPKN